MERFDGLLLNVDCQFGAGNVQRVEAELSAVVDHHVQEKALPELCVFQPGVGSCSVLVWRLLADAGFPLAKDLQTAMLYGLTRIRTAIPRAGIRWTGTCGTP